MDLVKVILSYDSRFVIRNGNIVFINKLDQLVVQKIHKLLLQVPQKIDMCYFRIANNKWDAGVYLNDYTMSLSYSCKSNGKIICLFVNETNYDNNVYFPLP